MRRTAVVLYNLGGPDSSAAVRPFLKNLFSDPMILRVPAPVRWLLARLIAWRRAPVARDIYDQIGGASPILQETEKQAAALQERLGDGYRTFVSMRYWHPFATETVRKVVEWGPDRVILLPLYPQFSTTTTKSFSQTWKNAAKSAKFEVSMAELCCWPEEKGFVTAIIGRIQASLTKLPEDQPFRILFSAHGLPKKIVAAGDPYADQVERTAAAVREGLDIDSLDSAVCYQSRVGPMEWLRPYTEDEIRRAGADGKALVVVPIAFVSEHSETLVELDIEYAELAADSGVPAYVRVPTVNDDPAFIDGLARLVAAAPETGTAAGGARCGGGFADCPCRTAMG